MAVTKSKHEFKIGLTSILLWIIFIMPFVDTFSGILHDIVPIGQMYRFVYFILVFVSLLKTKKKSFCIQSIAFLLFLIFQIVVSSSYILRSIQDVVKLFTPIYTIELFFTHSKRNRLLKVFDLWAIIYPLLIIIPGIMGVGTSSYDGTVGWKGFFYAINEISFIISSLVMYSFWKLSRELNIKNLVVLLLCCVCVVGMGTKTGYATIVTFAILFIWDFLKEDKRNRKRKIFIIIALVALFIGLNIRSIEVLTAGIRERWFYQNEMSYSLIDFLTSHRLRRLQGAWKIFATENILYPFIGWGLGGELAGFPNMEMDFIDLLFRTGLIGSAIVLLLYIDKGIHIFNKNKWGRRILFWSLALSFGAGHVLFYGQSGMMLAMNFILASIIKDIGLKKDVILKNILNNLQ